MPLKIVTLTGIDDHTPIDGLRSLSNDYPFVEFGILLDFKFAGNGDECTRYPSLECINTLAIRHGVGCKPNDKMPLALHLCGGRAIEEFLQNADSATASLARQVDRVQVNYDPMSELSLRELNRAMAHFPNQTIITQHGDYMPRSHWRSLTSPNHAVLFDSSQGVGRLPAVWSEPLQGKFCGYAGGLGPDNIEAQLNAIHDAATAMGAADPEPYYWIDMETHLRDDRDRFCLTRCETVLKKVKANDLVR